VVQLVRRGEWVLLVLLGLLLVVEGERKMWVDHNTQACFDYASESREIVEYAMGIMSMAGIQVD
jgi:hypothetical protein